MVQKRKKTKWLKVRMDDNEYREVKDRADYCDMSVADYIRGLIRDDIDRETLDYDYGLSEEDYWNGH